MFTWSRRSIERLETCHPLLRELMWRVIRHPELPCDITILEGYRGKEAQDAAFASGASRNKWPTSKHNHVPSLAVDMVPYVNGPVWDWDLINPLAPIIKECWANMEESNLTGTWILSWGGDWRSLKDGPHWELRGD